MSCSSFYLDLLLAGILGLTSAACSVPDPSLTTCYVDDDSISDEQLAAIEGGVHAWEQATPFRCAQTVHIRGYRDVGEGEIAFHGTTALGHKILGLCVRGRSDLDSGEITLLSGTTQAIVVHELGHALGMEHTNYTDSVMTPIDAGMNVPTAYDIAVFRALYGIAQ